MVSLGRRSGSGAWIWQRQGEKWRTGISFAAVVGKDEGPAPSCLPHSLPSILILSVRLLPLQIPNGSQLLGQAGDAAFPSRRMAGGRGWAPQGLQVPGHLQRSLEWGGRMAEGLGGGSGGRGGWGGRTKGLCPPHSCGRGGGLAVRGRAPWSVAPPSLSQLLPGLRLCPSCWKWDKTRSSPCWGPVSAQS